MLLGIEYGGIGGGLLSFVDLFDESIYGLAGLNGHIFVLLDEVDVEFVEELDVVLGGNEIPL